MIALPLSSRIGTAASRGAVIGLEQGMSAMGGAAPSAMGSLALPALAFVFTLLLVGYGVWDLDQLSGPGPSGHYSLAVTRVAPPAATAAASARGWPPVAGSRWASPWASFTAKGLLVTVAPQAPCWSRFGGGGATVARSAGRAAGCGPVQLAGPCAKVRCQA